MRLHSRHGHRLDEFARVGETLLKPQTRVRSTVTDATVPHALSRRLPPGEVDGIVAAYEAGDSARKISQRHRLSETSVLKLLHERGVVVTSAKLSIRDVERAAHLYKKGWKQSAIAETLEVSRPTVGRALRASGVPTRRRT